MRPAHATFLVDPYTRQPLRLTVLAEQDGEIVEGFFHNPGTDNLYPILRRVPVMIYGRLPKDFARRHRDALLQAVGSERKLAAQVSHAPEAFSFSAEWNEAYGDGVRSVWGQSEDVRLAEHFTDTDTTPAYYPGRRVLDVGCGNGILCRRLAGLGATVFGIDYSEAVFNAAEGAAHENACFVQADLHHLPFLPETFDLVYSNGVIHHTPSTERAFAAVLPVVRRGGGYYVWLYRRRPDAPGFNRFLYATDALRAVVNKLPAGVQKSLIELLVDAKIAFNRARGRPVADVPTAKLELYDTLTPAYKFYHTEEEVLGWHRRYGLSQGRQTHQNPYGFGVLGIRD